MQTSVRQALADNDYPGRGLLVTRAPEQTYVSTLTVGDVGIGGGILTTTYLSQDRQVVATHQPPVEVTVDAPDAAALLELVWSSLAADLRVAAAVIRPTAAEPLAAELVRSA